MNNQFNAKPLNINSEQFGEIKTDGYFTQIVRRTMERQKLSSDAIDSILNNAVEILNYFPNPKNTDMEFQKTGIVIGKVQSGKTSNFIALLALAFDNNYRLSVVIGGNTTELLGQNVDRINETFKEAIDDHKLQVLISKENNEIIKSNTITRWFNEGLRVVLVTLKNPSKQQEQHLTKISNLFNDEILQNEPVIIIDDEGDQATLNSKRYDKKVSVSETYRVALDIKRKLKKHVFVSITATPHANLLIEKFDKLSPDFVSLIHPGEGYCGSAVFHSKDQDKYIKVITDDETILLDKNRAGIPDSLIKAISTFFVGNAIRKARGDYGFHSMLIHPSEKISDHKIVSEKVEKFLDKWKAVIDLYRDGDASYNRSIKIYLKEAYDMLIKDGVKTLEFNDLEDEIINCIVSNSPIFVFNSDNKNVSNNHEKFKTRIYVGGNIMGRGITIKGLAVTYITRRAKTKTNVDTVEQRARWFGYKRSYLDVCRVWATEQIKTDFSTINRTEEDMWEKIQNHINSGKPFKEMKVVFLQENKGLQVTRQNVVKTTKRKISGWKNQQYFVHNANDAKENEKILDDFLKDKNESILVYDEVNKHKIYRDIDIADFNINCLEKMKFAENEKLINFLMETFVNILKDRMSNTKIDVVLVRYESKEARKIKPDWELGNIFRGRDLKKKDSEDDEELKYYGDKSLIDESPDNIQIQIHYIKPSDQNTDSYSPTEENVDFYSPTVAFYIPDEYGTAYEERK